MMKLVILLLMTAVLLYGDFIRNDQTQTVYDTERKVTWLDTTAVGNIYTNLDAKAYCTNLLFAKENDWYLPDRIELANIVGVPQFQYSPYNFCWSSTIAIMPSGGFGAWAIQFYGDNSGYEAILNINFNYAARCVRKGKLKKSGNSAAGTVAVMYYLIQ